MAGPRGRLAEVFRSIQGEGLLLGRRQVFVRLAGCHVACRYCDTAWAFDAPADLAVPGSDQRLPNPVSVEDTVALVQAADPHGEAPSCPVSLTGGEPAEQPEFAAALMAALAPREVMLETSGLHAEALALLVPAARWVACDLKLPTATGQPDVFERHEAVFASGVLGSSEVFFKLVVDGQTAPEEVGQAAALLARYHPDAPVFLQPVTALGGSASLPRNRIDAHLDWLLGLGLDARVVPQVHKVLAVR